MCNVGHNVGNLGPKCSGGLVLFGYSWGWAYFFHGKARCRPELNGSINLWASSSFWLVGIILWAAVDLLLPACFWDFSGLF